MPEDKEYYVYTQDINRPGLQFAGYFEHFAFDSWHYDCPFCDDGFATKERCEALPNYCGNCGAKMDGGKTE